MGYLKHDFTRGAITAIGLDDDERHIDVTLKNPLTRIEKKFTKALASVDGVRSADGTDTITVWFDRPAVQVKAALLTAFVGSGYISPEDQPAAQRDLGIS